MEELITQYQALIRQKFPIFRRFLFDEIHWESRLIGIKGARGTGKTTLLLQWLKAQKLAPNKAVYISLDDIYFSQNDLKTLLVNFHEKGGEIVILDEVHKYPNWSQVIKNIYDFYPELKIIFTGSSIIDISKQEADLSRRAVIYELPGLSYREFLAMHYDINLPKLSLEEIVSKNDSIYSVFPSEFKPLANFKEYLQLGYYPFLLEEPLTSQYRMNQLIRTVVESDMAELKDFDIRNAHKMLQLLYVIAQQVPFSPNISKLAEQTGIHRNTLNNYLFFLEKAKLISLVYTAGKSTSTLQKPDKIYLNNTALIHTLAEDKSNIGNVRETFFYSQVNQINSIELPKKGDFFVGNKYTFEVGGKNKSQKQIKEIENAFIVKDDVAFSSGNNIPLWLFGFLY
ncbi:AAA family ATPase [Brumimicrobium salinarum]|uniref:AAA family ATPase n=1 Tax=Brumimicrobium salinarum TaxID=2058658 RepID=A0A2I0QZK1_9FLAO|nr:AAA family ATPase [Brumimicrobium salinarum]PKR79761.1 AAA family ATPase [Brumimicrobium salinarum]